MARQFRADPDGYHGRSKAGQEFFHGPQAPEESDAPEWLYALAETVAGNMTTFSGPGPAGLPLAARPGRPLPGQDSHLLERQTFCGARGPPREKAIPSISTNSSGRQTSAMA